MSKKPDSKKDETKKHEHHHEHHEFGLLSLNRRRVLQRQMDALERKENLVRVMGPTMPPHG